MNDQDRREFDDLKRDVSFIKDTLVIALENHLKHIEDYTKENREMAEQSWLASEAAEKRAARTEKFVVGGVTFLGLIIGVIACLTSAG